MNPPRQGEGGSGGPLIPSGGNSRKLFHESGTKSQGTHSSGLNEMSLPEEPGGCPNIGSVNHHQRQKAHDFRTLAFSIQNLYSKS